VWVIVIPDAGIIALVTPVRLQLKRLNYQHGRPGQVLEGYCWFIR
jgi:hypothetical protein